MSVFSNQQRNYLDKAFSLGGTPITLGTIIENMNTQIFNGSLAIASNPADVDAVCMDAEAFAWDQDATNGLSFAWDEGQFYNGQVAVPVGGGTIALSASTTNYIEVDRSGAVYTNTSGFTPGRFPLYEVLTGSSSIAAANVTRIKPLISFTGIAGVVGSMLSTAGATKTVSFKAGTVAGSGTTTINLPLPNIAGTISDIRISSQSALADSGTNYQSISVTNLGGAGTGATNVLSTAAGVNSTNVTGGSSITANVQRSLVLSGTGVNLQTNAKDMLQMVLTPTGAPGSLTDFTVEVDLQISN